MVKRKTSVRRRVNKKMKFRKTILILTIVSLVIVAGAIGTSYAYYSLTNTDIDITTKNISAGQVTFSGNNYIKMKTGVPISASEVETYASKSIFTITPPSNTENDHEFAFNVILTDISIDSVLKVADFNYKLICSSNSNELDVSDETDTSVGDGTAFTTTTLLLGTFSSEENADMLNYNTTCTLYVWLEDSGVNQNSLMDKSFSAYIKVNTAVKAK